MGLFSSQKTPKELARDQQKELRGAQRDLSKDDSALQREEKRLVLRN